MTKQAPCIGKRAAVAAAARLALAIAVWLAAAPLARAQDGCALVPDERNPREKILRCGEGLTIRVAPSTVYRLLTAPGSRQPTGARLDSGALMIELDRSKTKRNFQIQTPHAIAAVRGTTWATEVNATQTSTFVVAGAVAVTRANRGDGVVLNAGEGVDVPAGTGPLTVKVWSEDRARTLLGRFGQ
jgi:ferric-dicitrate binding protein FerR (iron transport regulator)